MKIEFIHEPELEFGTGQKHIDIKFGIKNYGPLDYDSPLAPKKIKLGIVGSTRSIDSVSAWLENCRNEIPAKKSNQPNLFPKFPGFNEDIAFRSTLVLDTKLQRNIPFRKFDKLIKSTNYNFIVENAADLFYEELAYLAGNTPCDVLLCTVPIDLLIAMTVHDPYDPNRRNKEIRFDFHDMLKAKVMTLGKPTQILLPTTFSKSARSQWKKELEQAKQVQDEATIAWNIHTAMYYKANGTPWRLIRDPKQFSTCFIGVCFYKTLDHQKMQTSVAQVFNERGEGVVIKGGTAQISKNDRQPHLSTENAHQLLNQALEQYRKEHGNLPARVVIHKTSRNNDEEIDGFRQALAEHRIDFADFLYISQAFTRLFRHGEYPPLRGTLWSLDESTHVFYTTGSVDFYSTYPGMYIPRPLQFECDDVEQAPSFLAQEILALTKMNWNDTQFDGLEPITIRAAHQVSSVLKYLKEGDSIESSYRFYM